MSSLDLKDGTYPSTEGCDWYIECSAGVTYKRQCDMGRVRRDQTRVSMLLKERFDWAMLTSLGGGILDLGPKWDKPVTFSNQISVLLVGPDNNSTEAWDIRRSLLSIL